MKKVHIGARKTVDADEVVLLESDVNYTFVHLICGARIHVATTLKKLEHRFSPFESFVRTSKSHIINSLHLLNYTENKITMQNNLSAIVSRRRRQVMIKFTAFVPIQ